LKDEKFKSARRQKVQEICVDSEAQF